MARFGITVSGSGTTLFLAGFISLLGQTVILRELNVAFHGVELIYPIAIGGWMIFAALGTLLSRGWPSRDRIAIFFTLFAFFLLFGIVFIRGSGLGGDNPACFSPLPFQQIATFLVPLLSFGLISGMMFSEFSSLHIESNGTPEGAYALGAAGGAAGGILATAGIHYGFSNFSLALVCVLLASMSAMPHFQKKRGRYGRFVAIALGLLAIAFLCKASRLDMRMTAWSHPDLFFADDFPSGRLAATSRNGDVSVFENNNLVYTTKDNQGARFAHLAALQHPEPRRILEIGGGWDGSVRELLLHKPVRIDVILPAGDPFIRFRLPGEIRKSLAHPAVHLSHADPRMFLKYKGFAWDMIIVDLTAPLSCRTNSFSTRNFFASLAARLYHGGIVVIRLPSPEALRTNSEFIHAAAVYRSLASVFPEMLIIPGTTTLIASSFAPLSNSPEVLTDRLRERGITSRHISKSSIQKLFASENSACPGNRLNGEGSHGNYDFRPVCYTYAALSWTAYLPRSILSRIPDFAAIRKQSLPIALFAGIVILLLFAGSRLRPEWQKTVLTISSGFLGMSSETLLILCYGAQEGILYQQIPLLLAAFMAGLSLGTSIFHDLTAKTGNPGKRSLTFANRNCFWGALLLMGFMLLNATTLGISKSDVGNLPLAISLSAASGFLTGGVFACAGPYRIGEYKRRSSLYKADLIGGSLGALSAGLFLIPVFGLAATSMALIIIAALALLLA
jgi:spermidine synthase